MLKIIIMIVTLALLSSAAFAGRGGCAGVHKGKRIIFNGLITNPMDTSTGNGNISVGGRVVAEFDGEDLKINYLFQTFKATNNHGDLVEGKVTDMRKMTGVMKRLYVRGFGIDYRNIPMKCWSK